MEDTLQNVWAWGSRHLEALLLASSVGSAMLAVVSALALPWFINRLPSDYFVHQARNEWLGRVAPQWRGFLVVGKNAVGWMLVVAGLLMLVLPGQGILTLLVALSLVDFPGKYRFERWLLHRDSVYNVLNWIRKRANKTPFERPTRQ